MHEEYNFYIKHFWKNESYKCDLAIRYAEGSRLQKLKEKYFVILQNEINEIGKQNVEIPIGALVGNKYFAGFGPKVKIRIIPAVDIITDIKTEFKAAGINQTVYRIYLNLECNISILTSYKTINTTINNQVLLVETVVVGEVPETYLELENIGE